MRPIGEIKTFGAVDADSDTLLFDCFEDHEAYESVLSMDKFLVLGRKGAGKTAIFKILLSSKRPGLFSYGHTFTDYPWEHHTRQKRTNVPMAEAYFHSWTYLILMSLAKIALNMDQSLPYDDSHFGDLESLERFVIDSYGSRDPDLSQVFRPEQKLKIAPHLNINLGFAELGANTDWISVDDLPRFIPEVNKSISEHLLGSLNPEHAYHIAFDQLDLDFDPDNEDYKQRLIGLILAARRLNLRARDVGTQLCVSVFLRTDIYDVLQFEDKNKITENDSVRIEWDTSGTGHTLKELMERRFSSVLGASTQVSWDNVFNGAEMAGRQRQYDYILARTYSRPRDMIKFCNEILNAYKQRLSKETHVPTTFENDDILGARENYSSYFLAEIDDELHKQLPEYKGYLDLLKAVGFYQFDRAAFEDTYDRRSAEFGIKESAADVLRSLFRFSIIGFRRTGGRAGGSEWVFAYLDPRSRFDEEATQLRVHYGLIEVLNLKRAQKGGSDA
jgi:hypothetical protein